MNIEYSFNILPKDISLQIIEKLDWNKNGSLFRFSRTSKDNRALVELSPLFHIFRSLTYLSPIPYLTERSLASLNYTVKWIKPSNLPFSRLAELDPRGYKATQLLRQRWKEERFEQFLIDLLPYLKWICQPVLFNQKSRLKKIAEEGMQLFKLAEKIPNLTQDELEQFKIVKKFSFAQLDMLDSKVSPSLQSKKEYREQLKSRISSKHNVDHHLHQDLVKLIIENELHENIHLFAPDILNDKEMIKFSLLSGNIKLFPFATAFHQDRDVAALAVQVEGTLLKHLSLLLKDDEEIVTLAALSSFSSLNYASARLRNKASFFWKLYKLYEGHQSLATIPYLLRCFDNSLRENEELFLQLVGSHPHCLRDASEKIQNNKAVVLTAIRRDYKAFQYASLELKNDIEVFEVMLESYQKSQSACLDIPYFALGPSLLSNVSVIARLIQANVFLETIALAHKNNPAIFLLIVAKNATLLKYASPTLKKNYEVVLTAVKQNGLALEHADNTLKSHPEIIEAALNQNLEAFKFIAPELKIFC